MNSPTDYRIRPMTREDLDLAVSWAAAEGWNPGNSDASCYFGADPQGFLMGFLLDTPVSCISAVKYEGGFGFVGFYIVKPEFRGKGFGIQIWNHALEYLKGTNVGLDGVVDQQENYRKSGFKLAYRNIRYEGKADGTRPCSEEVVTLDSLPLSGVLQYDRAFFPSPRHAFTRHWVSQPGSISCGLMIDGDLSGMGVIRPCRSGWKIGPLYAETPEQATSLYEALLSKVPAGDPVYLDVPEVNPAAVSLAADQGMVPVFETARMYTGEFPELPFDRLYGVTSFEIG